jgi:acyl-CoA thioesterase FadM
MTHAFVDRRTSKPTAIPAPLRQALEAIARLKADDSVDE